MTISKKGRPIKTLEDWEKFGGPKMAEHWQDDRSAKEVARAWLSVRSPHLPLEVAQALNSSAHFGTVTEWSAEPEARLPFDRRRGEPRNSDLLVRAIDEFGDFIIAVEAKADEPFAATVGQTLAYATKRKKRYFRSKGDERVRDLVASVLGSTLEEEPALAELRYQLVTAAAGAAQASVSAGGVRALLLIQEFITARTTSDKCEANGRDLKEFVKRLSRGTVAEIEDGVIYGPFHIRGQPVFTAAPPLFIGKVRRELHERSYP